MTDKLDGMRLYAVRLTRCFDVVVAAPNARAASVCAQQDSEAIVGDCCLFYDSVEIVEPITQREQIPDGWEGLTPYGDTTLTVAALWEKIERRDSEAVHGQQSLALPEENEDPESSLFALKVFCRSNGLAYNSEHINEGKAFLVTLRRNGSLMGAAMGKTFDAAVLKLLQTAEV